MVSDSGQQTADNRQQTADSRQRPADTNLVDDVSDADAGDVHDGAEEQQHFVQHILRRGGVGRVQLRDLAWREGRSMRC